uniref:Uncharacterized protein n=1 Tax=Eutreptiella gymnastica TaxID=73025 RepID=A0A7S1IHD2_9EUGL|mmetsp:Transcript_18752/g.33147  ORF Transcript_18752/g.33147 Transcript_18752/m.33147 type:complete len:531 (+) Transcript_18752:145-1737(+)
MLCESESRESDDMTLELSTDTALYVLSGSPRSRVSAIRIQAVYRGFQCRRQFKMNLLLEAIEDLEESQDWERDEVAQSEAEAFHHLVVQAREWVRAPSTAASAIPRQGTAASAQAQAYSTRPVSTPWASTGNDVPANHIVYTFCRSMDQSLRKEFSNPLCKEFLPPSWRHRWWDLDTEVPDCSQQLYVIYDCVQHMISKVKQLVDGICQLDPAPAFQAIMPQYENLTKTQEAIRMKAYGIEKQLGDLVGKVNHTQAQQQVKDFDMYLQREREYRDDCGYLSAMLELPAADKEARLQRRRRSRMMGMNAQQGSASSGSSVSTETNASADEGGQTISQLLERLSRCQRDLTARTCDRWKTVLHKRQANIMKAAALYSNLESSVTLASCQANIGHANEVANQVYHFSSNASIPQPPQPPQPPHHGQPRGIHRPTGSVQGAYQGSRAPAKLTNLSRQTHQFPDFSPVKQPRPPAGAFHHPHAVQDVSDKELAWANTSMRSPLKTVPKLLETEVGDPYKNSEMRASAEMKFADVY